MRNSIPSSPHHLPRRVLILGAACPVCIVSVNHRAWPSFDRCGRPVMRSPNNATSHLAASCKMWGSSKLHWRCRQPMNSYLSFLDFAAVELNAMHESGSRLSPQLPHCLPTNGRRTQYPAMVRPQRAPGRIRTKKPLFDCRLLDMRSACCRTSTPSPWKICSRLTT